MPQRLRSSACVVIAVGLVVRTAANARAAKPEAELSAPAAALVAPQTEAAKRHFSIGLQLYRQGAKAEALVEFSTSYRVGGRWSALRNVAQCQRDLLQFAEAYESLRLLLDRHSDQLAPGDKSAVNAALKELAELTGSIRITGAGRDVVVMLDGRPMDQASLGKPRRVAIGAHRVRATKDGFKPFEHNDIMIASQQEALIEIALMPDRPTGHVTVREQADHFVHVFVDGLDQGHAPWEGDLATGTHRVEVKGWTYAAEPRTITVFRDQRVDLVFSAESLQGHLRVVATPSSAAIWIDGKAVGTGTFEADFIAGPHRIEARTPGGGAASREVVLKRGEPLVQEVAVSEARAPAAPAPAEPEFRGIYGRVTVNGALTPPATFLKGGPSEREFKGWGLGGTVHLGYNFDPFGLEIVGVFAYYEHDQQFNISSAGDPQDRLKATGYESFLGIGPRVMSRGLVRFTLAFALGGAWHSINFQRDSLSPFGSSPPPTASFQADDTYAQPAVRADAGVIIGYPPGTTFSLGAYCLGEPWVGLRDTPLDRIALDGRAGINEDDREHQGNRYKLNSGSALAFGLAIGLQFGH